MQSPYGINTAIKAETPIGKHIYLHWFCPLEVPHRFVKCTKTWVNI